MSHMNHIKLSKIVDKYMIKAAEEGLTPFIEDVCFANKDEHFKLRLIMVDLVFELLNEVALNESSSNNSTK